MAPVVSMLTKIKDNFSENILDVRVLTNYRRFWNFLGLWPRDEDAAKNNWTSRIHYAFPRCVLGIAVYCGFVSGTISIYNNTDNIPKLATLICFEGSSAVAFVKVAGLIYQPDRINLIATTLDRFQDVQRYGDTYSVDILRRVKLFSKMISVYAPLSASAFMFLFNFVGLVITLKTRTLPFNLWYPCDSEYSPCFEITAFLQLTLGAPLIVSMGMGDGFFIDLLVHIWMQFKILGHNVAQISRNSEREEQHETDSESQDEIRSLNQNEHTSVNMPCGSKHPIKMSDRILNDMKEQPTTRNAETLELAKKSYVSVERDARLRLRKKVQRTLKIERDLDLKMEKRLHECAKHHQDLLSLTTHVNNLFNPAMVVLLMSNLVLGTAMALNFLIVRGMQVEGIVIVILNTMNILELCVICWVSNQITQVSGEIKDSVYGCDWFEASASFKKSMRIMISRSNDPVVIRAATFIPLSMVTFNEVCKTGYSYLSVMLKLVGDKK